MHIPANRRRHLHARLLVLGCTLLITHRHKRHIQYRQRIAPAKAPHEPLRRSGQDLPVFPDQALLGADEDHRAVQRPAVPLDHAADEEQVQRGGDGLDAL